MFDYVLKGQEYLLYIMFIMISVGIIKEHHLFAELQSALQKLITSKRGIVALMSGIGGLLPIPGRVTTSAGLLDTMAPDCDHCSSRSKFGVVDYLATHHYYMWSPLEKTIILPMSVLGLAYFDVITQLWPLIVVSFGILFYYIIFVMKEEDIVMEFEFSNIIWHQIFLQSAPFFVAIAAIVYGIAPYYALAILTFYYIVYASEYDYKKLIGHINWNVILTVAIIIVIANITKSYTNEIKDYVENVGGFATATAVGFFGAWILGSSSRFAAITVILTSIYGIEYFVWFFAVEFAGYLVSPTHKCAAIGMTYFGTPIQKYAVMLGLWALMVVTTAGIVIIL